MAGPDEQEKFFTAYRHVTGGDSNHLPTIPTGGPRSRPGASLDWRLGRDYRRAGPEAGLDGSDGDVRNPVERADAY